MLFKVSRHVCVCVAGVNFQFLDDNLSLLWPIDTKLGVWLADVKRQLGISTQLSMMKVKVIVQ